MKSIWQIILVSAFLLGCENEKKSFLEGNLTVKFDIDQLEQQKVVLELITFNPKRIQLDTIEGEKGKGTFILNTDRTSFYSVYIPGKEGEIRFMANPNDIITVTGNANNLFASSKISGTPENKRLDSLITYIKATKYYTDSLQKVFKKAESKQMHYALIDQFQTLYGNAKLKEEVYVTNFVLRNPGQFSNLMAVNSLDKNRHKKIFQLIDSALLNNFQNNEDVIKFHSIIDSWYSSAIGKKAPNFTLLNSEGKTTSLSDYEGKYVLLDFWNTGCRPCIQEIPNLKRIQKEFGGDKFEIISICIDRNNPGTQDVWRRINEKYQTNWTQVYDAGGLATAKKYKITHYPTMMVLDPLGNIIDAGNHVRGEQAYQIIRNLVSYD
ncbi:MAG: hypothetical protein CMD18_07975 [Flavobacteriales bacterium]|nr:hypothetical protein [Flavobacteriales bacterium]|tara:strand:- start:40 stop:1179 length:1140 start_codon:yes stop_codon:yes gene_type:complete